MSAAAALTADLVAIDSVNPEVVPGGAGEGEIARFVAAWCERAGLAVELVEPVAGRPSVLATARGLHGGPTLLLNGHIDTVGHAGMECGLEPRIEGGRLYGRGAYDMKGGVAAILLAAAEAQRRGPPGDVVVAAVADEEHASLGTAAVLERVRADAAIVTEPTGMRVSIAHRGFASFAVEVEGVAAHGSRPDLGVDAIVRMGRVLGGIEALERELTGRPRHPLLGRGSIHAGTIEGGEGYSVYPARCRLTGERRTLPHESERDAEAELAAILDRAGEGDPAFRGRLALELARPAFAIEPTHPLVELVRASAGAELGAEPELAGEAYWADSGLISAAGIPCVLLGPGGAGAHADVEWVELADVERLVAILVRVAAGLAG